MCVGVLLGGVGWVVVVGGGGQPHTNTIEGSPEWDAWLGKWRAGMSGHRTHIFGCGHMWAIWLAGKYYNFVKFDDTAVAQVHQFLRSYEMGGTDLPPNVRMTHQLTKLWEAGMDAWLHMLARMCMHTCRHAHSQLSG